MRTAWQAPPPLRTPVAWLRLVVRCVLWTFCLCAMSGAAWAANATIMNSTAAGTLSPAERTSLRGVIDKTLQGMQLTVLPESDIEVVVSGEPQLKDCYSDLCLERVGRLLDSQIIVNFHVKPLAAPPAGKGGLQLSVEVFDSEVGATGTRLTQECSGCSGAQAAGPLGDLVKRAVQDNTARPRGVLEVESQPAGASVFVDGTELGITPYKRAAFAGKHKVVLSHIGYRSHQVEVPVDAGAPQRVEVKLAAGTEPVSPASEREKTPVYKKWWFWVALGGAAVAVSAITAGVIVGAGARAGGSADRMTPANTLVVSF